MEKDGRPLPSARPASGGQAERAASAVRALRVDSPRVTEPVRLMVQAMQQFLGFPGGFKVHSMLVGGG
jgi:hypothetical protein